MNKLFLYDSLNDKSYTYQRVIDDLNGLSEFNPVCCKKDFYEIFLCLLHSLILDHPITLVDYDLISSAILQDISSMFPVSSLGKNNVKITGDIELISRVKEVRNWSLTLYTSGTTGKPKAVTHSYVNLTRAVRIRDNMADDIWGFAYHPAHIAGVQVFFQALLNGNSIINLFGLSQDQIFELIDKYKITNISATPTFLRLLLPYPKIYPSVKRITSGGEQFDARLIDRIKETFPSSKVINVYASTEVGTIFESLGESFIVKKPEIVKIVNGELLIRDDYIGVSDELQVDDGWYHSGDLVDIIEENPLTIKIIGRTNEMINIGGYKVYPVEVEKEINLFSGVTTSRVYAQKNSLTGNILVCDIVVNDISFTEAKLRKFLSDRLASFQIPRMFNQVEQICTTNTGKIKRNI